MKMVKSKNMFLATATAVLLVSGFAGVANVEASGVSAVSQISSNKTLQTMVKVDVRSTASSKGKVFMSIPQGETVKVVGNKGGWQKVTYNGKMGWVGGHYLTSKAVSNAYKTKNAVDIRDTAWSKGKVIQKVPVGIVLKVTASKNGWQKVTYNGKTGWVGAHHLASVTASNDYETKNAVDIRDTAWSKGKVIQKVPAGVKVTVTDSRNGWEKISYNGVTGWVGGHHLEKVGEKAEPVVVAPTKPTAPSQNDYPTSKRLNKKEANVYLEKTMENNAEFNSFDLIIDNELALTIGFTDEKNVNASVGIFKPAYTKHRSQMDEAIYTYAETQTGIRTSYTKNLSNDIKTFLATSKTGENLTKTYGSQSYQFRSQDKFVRIERK